MYEALQQNQSVNIRQISDNRAEQVGYYRFLENENVTVSELVQSIAEHCQQNVAERHVLAISDSSEINLQSHIGRLKSEGLGVVGNNTDVGFYLHPTLVVDSERGFPLGLSTIQLWTRDLDHQDKEERNYKKLPIEEKESYKWLASAERSQRCLVAGGAKMVTHIGDRESDLYEEWATVPDKYNQLLVRVCQDRRLFDQEQSLYSYLRQQPVVGTYTIDVPADKRIPRVARKAWLKVRLAQVKIRRPDTLTAFDYPASVTLYAVEVEEIAPPTGQKPIHWRLMTTHDVLSFEQALQIIEWYKWRWWIEQLFATLKKAGLNLEATQLESPRAIHKLAILALSIAVRTLQMVEGRDNSELPASVAFDAQQQECLSQISPSLQGTTRKQQNPYPPDSLPWATWLIARLGGWSGYRSQRPPGMPTLVHGLKRFESIFWGWKLSQYQLVCTR